MIWKITLSSNETHTLTSPPKDYEDLVSLVQLKYNLKDPGYFSLRYIDADDEFITLSGEEDFDTAILSCRQEKLQALEIFVFPGTALMQQVQKDMVASITSSLKKDKIWTPYDKYHSMLMTKPGNSVNLKCKTNGSKETAQKSKRSSSCPLWNQDAAHDQEAKESKRKRSEILARAVDKLEKQVQVEITEILPQMIGAIKNVFEPSKAKPARQQPQIGKSFAKDTLKEPVTMIADPIEDMIESLPSLSTKLERHQSHRPSALQGITKESLKDAFPGSFNLTRRPRAGTYIGNCQDQANLTSPPLFKNVSANPPSTYLTVRRNCLRKDSDDFKVFLSRTNPDEPIKVEPMRCYKVAFELRNCGDVKLPEGVRLVCVNGINKGNEKMVPSLEPGRSITTELSLRAPKEQGKYLSQWKISYGKGDKQRSIGESVFEEICVGSAACNSPENAKKESSCQSPEVQEMGKAARSFSKSEPEELDELPGLTSLKRGQSTLVTGEDKVKCAKFLNEVFPGNFREKMNFVREISKEVTISDIVERYLQMPRPTKY